MDTADNETLLLNDDPAVYALQRVARVRTAILEGADARTSFGDDNPLVSGQHRAAVRHRAQLNQRQA
jgi:hypothetical protein